MKPIVRTAAVVLAATFALATPALQALAPFGLTAAEFSYQGDSTLRVAGYAFAIWGVLYAGMLAYAVHQALPRTPASPALDAFAWPSVIAMAGCGLWLIAAARDARWTTVAVIATAAVALITAMLRRRPQASLRDTLFIVAPLSLLAGWLTIAAAANILTVLTMENAIGDPARAALMGVAAASAIALTVAIRARIASYLAPVVWGLAAIHAAESARQPEVAFAALAAAIALTAAGAAIAALALRRSRRQRG